MERLSYNLKGMPMFSSFDESDLDQMAGRMKAREYGRGQVVHLQGDICTSMDVVIEGKISVESIGADGGMLRVASFGRGSVIGMNLLFSSKNAYPMTVVADTRAAIVSVPREMVLEMGRMSFSFTEWLLMEISDRTLLLTDKLGSISMKTIRQKVLEYLYGEHLRQKSLKIRMDLSKKELAERLGINRTSLSRELDRMRKEDIIDFDRNSMTIRDINAVTGITAGNPHIRY